VRRILSGYHQPALVQTYVPGRELCVAVLGDNTLPPLEVRVAAKDRDFITAADKEGELWNNLSIDCPAPVAPAVADRLEELSLRACRALGVRHMARCDFRWSGDGEPLLIDVNPLPTLRPGGSFYVVAAGTAGLAYGALWDRLLAVAACGNRPLHSGQTSC
jgi:D-alanine-D-alanine ligase-like ATP-grasp enzyme